MVMKTRTTTPYTDHSLSVIR